MQQPIDSIPPLGTTRGSLILATLVGAALRGYTLTNQGLSHYDEGIYGISGLWPWTWMFEASQGYFSPPGYPFLVGLGNLCLGGPSDLGSLLVSWLFGTLTIPLAWFLGRKLPFSSSSTVCAWLVAIDPFQIAFSRSGLTDTTFTFFLSIAILQALSAVQSGGALRIVTACLVIGFTWNIKYHGFLPILLVLPSLLDSNWDVRLRRLATIGAGSFLIYLPWFLWFHVKHGYGSLIRHQSGYFHGPAAIPAGLGVVTHQFAEFPFHLSFAVIAVLLLIRIRNRNELNLAVFVAVLFGALSENQDLHFGLLVGSAVLVALRASKDRRSLFLLLWILGWLLLLPAAYTPYARLWLPGEAFLLVVIGTGLFAPRQPPGSGWLVAGWDKTERAESRKYHVVRFVAAVLIALLSHFLPFKGPNYHSDIREIFVSHAGYRTVAKNLKQRAAANHAEVFAFCRPPLIYYTAIDGLVIRRLSGGDPNVIPIAASQLLVVDPIIHDTPEMQRCLTAWKPELEVVDSWTIEPSLITKLDDTPTGRLRDLDPLRYVVTVYKRKLK